MILEGTGLDVIVPIPSDTPRTVQWLMDESAARFRAQRNLLVDIGELRLQPDSCE